MSPSLNRNLGVPSYEKSPADPVAMVFVKWENYRETLGRELIEKLDGLATDCSPEFYSATNR
jgi:hypothetical protein